MKTLVFDQYIPVSLDEAWEFFATPDNLNLITPDNMHFKTLSVVPKKLYEGLNIRYRIKPLMKIPMIWITRITSLQEKEYFIDEQLKGPYKVWRHEHYFKAVDNGVQMTDRITYDIGFGFIGKLAGKLWVDRQVKEIFSYRSDKLKMLFNKNVP